MAGILRESCILCAHMHARERERQRENHTSYYGFMLQTEICIFNERTHKKKKKIILAKGKMKYGTQV